MNLLLASLIITAVLFAPATVEKRLKSIENQNERIIKLLEEIRDKK